MTPPRAPDDHPVRPRSRTRPPAAQTHHHRQRPRRDLGLPCRHTRFIRQEHQLGRPVPGGVTPNRNPSPLPSTRGVAVHETQPTRLLDAAFLPLSKRRRPTPKTWPCSASARESSPVRGAVDLRRSERNQEGGRHHSSTAPMSRMRSRAPLGPCDRNWCQAVTSAAASRAPTLLKPARGTRQERALTHGPRSCSRPQPATTFVGAG